MFILPSSFPNVLFFEFQAKLAGPNGAASRGAAPQRPAAPPSPDIIMTKCDLPAAVSSHPGN